MGCGHNTEGEPDSPVFIAFGLRAEKTLQVVTKFKEQTQGSHVAEGNFITEIQLTGKSHTQ